MAESSGFKKCAFSLAMPSLLAAQLFLSSGCLAIVGGDVVSTTNTTVPVGCKTYASDWNVVQNVNQGQYGGFERIITDKAGTVFTGTNASTDWNIYSLPLASNNASADNASWDIVDDVIPSGGAAFGYVFGESIDPSGTIWFSGGSEDSSYNAVQSWVRSSSDGGKTWNQPDTYTGADIGGTTTLANGIDSDRQGNLYEVVVVDASTTASAVMRRSTDHGATWNTILHAQPAGRSVWPIQTLQLPNGHLFMIANGIDAGGIYSGVLYRSVDGGASFSLQSVYQVYPGKNSIFTRAASDGQGGLLITSSQDSSDGLSSTWQVLKSTDEGVSYTVLDDFSLATGQGSWSMVPYKVLQDAFGNLFVTGYGSDAIPAYHGLIRKSSDGGKTWSTFEDYTDSSNKPGFYDMTLDSGFNMFVAGSTAETNGIILRLSCLQTQ